MKTIRAIGGKIIAFLHQIENFQKRLFEKKKFVTDCHYCLTLDRVPEELYPEIAKNKEQIAEWKELFKIEQADGWSEPPTAAFLKKNWNLVVDTKFFGEGFVEAVLTFQNDIDDSLVGSALGASNQAALPFLAESYKGRVDCVFTDPPYNTGGDGFIYKDRFRHSSWAALIFEGMKHAEALMSETGSMFVTIDDNEVNFLVMLLGRVFGASNFVNTLIWQKVYSPKNSARHFSEDHDYIVVFAKNHDKWTPHLLPRTNEADDRYRDFDKDDRGVWKPSDLTARNFYSKGSYEIKGPTGKLSKPGIGRYWRQSEEKFWDMDRNNEVRWGPKKDAYPSQKQFLKDVQQGRVPQTIWPYKEVGHTQDAKKELLATVPYNDASKVLNTVKPTKLIQRITHLATPPDKKTVVLDFFAGSGSTGHADLKQNAEEDSQRQFLLIEAGDHFDSTVIPRLKRTLFSPIWTEKGPGDLASKGGIISYLRLESYEDALGNIAFDDNEAAQRQLSFDQYVLHYMLAYETGGSETLLDVMKLSAPFDYKLEIRDGEESSFKKVDLPETINFLIGLRVRTRKVLHRDKGKQKIKYLVLRGRTNPHATGGEREVVVIWRNTEGWKSPDFEADKKFIVTEHALTKGADEIFVNDDSVIPKAQSLDPIFKRRMFNQPDA